MDLLTKYNDVLAQIFAYFGYVENWRVIPLDDCRDYYWRLVGEGPGVVHYGSKEAVESYGNVDPGQYYIDAIYTQRFLPKWVYRGPEYTMVCCDPNVDGNKFLRIFNNSLELESG